jgi:polyhydroxybutyrate depolymerase
VRRIALALGLVVIVAACSSSGQHAAAPAATTTTTTVPPCVGQESAGHHTLNGRTYSLALPPADGKRHPMVLLFHGFASSATEIDAETGLDKLGTARGDIVVTPDGSSNPKTWNFIPGASGSTADDFGFIAALVAHLEQTSCVEPQHVYAAGHSAGSAFVGFLACHEPYSFAAIAMVSATIPSTCPPTVVQSVLSIHGTADTTVLYNGGKGIGQTVSIPPVKETVASLAQRAGCNATPVAGTPAPGVERLRYTGCANGKAVELLTIVNGQHPWPGGLQAKALEPSVPGAQFSASNAILDFFAAH